MNSFEGLWLLAPAQAKGGSGSQPAAQSHAAQVAFIRRRVFFCSRDAAAGLRKACFWRPPARDRRRCAERSTEREVKRKRVALSSKSVLSSVDLLLSPSDERDNYHWSTWWMHQDWLSTPSKDQGGASSLCCGLTHIKSKEQRDTPTT